MSNIASRIKYYYDSGLWNKERVHNMVVKGIITKNEYKTITGKDYE